jgi:hypothetical protein
MSGEQSLLDPNRLTPEQAVKLLSANPLAHVSQDFADSTIALIAYAAWLVKKIDFYEVESAQLPGRPTVGGV